MLNTAMVMGYLGGDPEMRYTAGNNPVCNFRMATTEKWKDAQGNLQERTEWHRVVVWGKQAEHCNEFLRKGRLVHVTGRLQTREWESNSGDKRWTTEIVADRVKFLPQGGQRSDAPTDGGEGRTYSDAPPPATGDSDIPF